MRVVAAVLAVALLAPGAAASDGGSVGLQTSEVVGNLIFPVSFAFAPDGRIFVTEKTGAIVVVDGGVVSPWTTLGAASSGEQGVLGVALHPVFAANGWVYAYYTDAANATNRVVRLTDSGGVGTDLAVIVDNIPRAGFHNGGVLAFATDGSLLISTGDVTSPANAQDLGTTAGKVLRVHDDGSIPGDNPFPGSAVYTYGHRNVFGLAVDPTTGHVWETENGPACNDELNRLIPGRNFGWGPSQSCTSPPPPPENTNRDGPNPVLPAYWFPDSLPAVTQATFYAGELYGPADRGALFFGGWNTGSLYRARLTADRQAIAEVDVVHTQSGWAILDVHTAPDGRLHFSAVNHDGSGGAIFALASLPPPRAGDDHFLAYFAGAVVLVILLVAYAWKRRQFRRERS